MNEPMTLWQVSRIVLTVFFGIAAGVGFLHIGFKAVGWIRAKIAARKKKREHSIDITVTADCSQAMAELRRLKRETERFRPQFAGESILKGPLTTFLTKENDMPTRKQIEDARDKCVEKWEFLPTISNGSGAEDYYTKLWLKHTSLEFKGDSGCAYCDLFNREGCKGCPLNISDDRCCKEYNIYCDAPTRENALAMLDKVKHSLDHYFDEGLIDIEPCICGAKHNGFVSGYAERQCPDNGVYIGYSYACCQDCGKKAPSKMDHANDRIRAWNKMIREEREERDKLPEVLDCTCGAKFNGVYSKQGMDTHSGVHLHTGSDCVHCEGKDGNGDCCTKTGPKGGSVKEFIVAWNSMIRREREEKARGKERNIVVMPLSMK